MNQPTSLAEGRYLLVEPLGEGGMATVYRAFDQRLQVWRAVKILSPDYADKKKIAKRFEAEAQTMALLEHKNIVRVYDVGRDGNIAYIVMELVEGGCLVDWLEHHGPMPPRMAVDAIVEVCDGLASAHDKGVIHRDIKPHNVMITRDGICRVTDFGIARVGDSETSLTKTGSVMGTWGYMAPEQRTNAKGVDARADVYAVGATLYSLLTDRMPMDLFAADRDSSMLEGVHELLVPALVRCTDYDREKRPASVRDLKAELLAVRDQLPPLPAGTPPLALVAASAPPVPDPTKYQSATDVGHVRAGTQATILPSEMGTASTDPAPTILPDGEMGDDASLPAASRAHAMTMPPEEVAVTQPGALTRQNRPVFAPGAVSPIQDRFERPGFEDDSPTDPGFETYRAGDTRRAPDGDVPRGPSTTSAMMFGATAAIWGVGGVLVVLALLFAGYRMYGPGAVAVPDPVPVQPVPVPTPPPVPGQPDPTQPVPGQPVPTQPVPGQPVPTQPVPTQPVPGQPVPTQPVPTQPVPTQPVPTQPVPVQPVPTQPVPVQPAPVEPVASGKPCVEVDSVGTNSQKSRVVFKMRPCGGFTASGATRVTLNYRPAGSSGPFVTQDLSVLSGKWTTAVQPVESLDYFLDGWGGSIGSKGTPKAFIAE